MGWFSKENDMEVLHLYMKDVKRSGLGFYPKPQINTVYYVDTFRPDRYIEIEKYFETAKKDRMTELRKIAYSLGAKRCSLESVEIEKGNKCFHSKVNANVSKGRLANGNGEVKGELLETDSNKRKIEFIQTFEGGDEPVRPEGLTWFAYDSEISFLIDTLCDGLASKTKTYCLKLSSTSSSTMSLNMATKIDGALKGMKIKTNFSFESKVKKETSRSFLFSIEF